jgi:hypothetical protein
LLLGTRRNSADACFDPFRRKEALIVQREAERACVPLPRSTAADGGGLVQVGVGVGVWCVWVGLSLVCVFLFVVGGSHTEKCGGC